MDWLWTLYFVLKLWMHFTGTIRIHAWPNLVLLVVAIPFTSALTLASRRLRMLRQVAAVALGICLLWYDSYLPPFLYAVRFGIEHTQVLNGAFLFDFARGFKPDAMWPAVLVLVTGLFLIATRIRLRPSPFIFLALMIVVVQSLRETGQVAEAATQFYAREKGRVVAFPKDLASPPFDIVILQICSLSWDDLEAVGQPHPRLLDDRNILFSNFNSATSYSGPAGLRLLRASCGQVDHGSLYDPWPADCDLVDNLRRAGYRTYAAYNFAPGYYGFSPQLQRLAGLDPPISVEGLPEQMLSFDNQPVFQNGPILRRWLATRQKDGAARAMLFYNTISLHGGGHWAGPHGWDISRLPFYTKVLEGLGEDVKSFESDLVAGGRSAVVIIMPEHGAALRGSMIQVADLRDIPLPRLTRVPVAVRFVGPLFADAPSMPVVDRPTSYMALATMLAELLNDPSTVSDRGRLQQMLDKLPQTDFMSETSQWKVLEFSGRYYLLGKDQTWNLLPTENEAPSGD